MLCAAALALFPGASAAEETAGEEAIGGPCAAALGLPPGAAPAEEDIGQETDGWPCAVVGHWREVAYFEPPMSSYYKYRGCVAWAAWQFELPEELLYAIMYVERGDISHCRCKRNGTHDCGPAKVKDMQLGEIRRFNLTGKLVRSTPCHDIWAMGYLLRREIDEAGAACGAARTATTTSIPPAAASTAGMSPACVQPGSG